MITKKQEANKTEIFGEYKNCPEYVAWLMAKEIKATEKPNAAVSPQRIIKADQARDYWFSLFKDCLKVVKGKEPSTQNIAVASEGAGMNDFKNKLK